MGQKKIAARRGKPGKYIVVVVVVVLLLLLLLLLLLGAEDRKGLGINSGKSVMRNTETETESMRNAESTRGCVNLNTVTEIKRSSHRDTFIAENTVFSLYRIHCGIGSLLNDKYHVFYNDTRTFIRQ